MASLRALLLILAVLLSFSSQAWAAPMCGKKVNSFDIVVDYSGSMMMQNAAVKEAKIDVAKVVLARINSIIPDLDYYAGLHTLAPTATLLNQDRWNRANMAESIQKLHSDFDIFGRLSPMGTGLSTYEPWLSSMQRNAALILVTDGDNNRGVSLLDVVRTMYATQRDLVVHVISLADNASGKETIRQIAALNPKSIVADGVALATNDAALESFVLSVWCEQSEEVIVLRGVNFAFDKANLDAQAQNILATAAHIIKTMPNKRVVLNGWTDTTGNDTYNVTLSQRRADAVKAYLTKQGIPPSRIQAFGRGESVKYSNSNNEGRYMNRRVEILFE